MNPRMTIEALKEYYLYSLMPKESEFRLIFGPEYKQQYNEALKYKKESTLTGFIKYWRNVKSKNIYNIIYKSQYK